MPQNQCQWCGTLSERYREGCPRDEQPQPHDDGSSCVCRHVTAQSRRGAIDAHGRYWDEALKAFLCFSCGTAVMTTAEEEDYEAARDAGLVY